MKDIVILAHFCRDFSITDNGRFTYLCKELSKDHHVEVITSDFNHATKKKKDPLLTQWPFKITFLSEPGYKKNISIRRFMSHRAWGMEVRKYLRSRKKPDVIYSAVPSLTGPFEAAKYCERNGIRFIIDVQDLWPEAFQMVLHNPILNKLLFWPFRYLADGIYSRADEICAVSGTYAGRALSVNQKTDKANCVFLGTSLKTFDEFARTNAVEKGKDELWIGYCGTLGASYDLSIVIEALAILKKNGKQVPRLIVLGDGEKKQAFEKQAEEEGIEATFTGRLPYEKMCGWLKACDVAVNPIKHKAAQSIINKHGDYAAAGIPVLNTQENQEYGDLVDNYHMGFNCDNSDPEDLARHVDVLVNDRELRETMGRNARRCAEERFDRTHAYAALMNCILKD